MSQFIIIPEELFFSNTPFSSSQIGLKNTYPCLYNMAKAILVDPNADGYLPF